MGDETRVVELGEHVARLARDIGIETIVIGAYALAIHRFIRASLVFDLGTRIAFEELCRLTRVIETTGLSIELHPPEAHACLGGEVLVWERVDDDGAPVEPVKVVNFFNRLRPRADIAAEAIEHALMLDEMPVLRYPTLAHLVGLKLDAGGRRDEADVIELLRQNPDADVEAIRATCKKYGLDKIDELIEYARSGRR
jgi:hypothetical protein